MILERAHVLTLLATAGALGLAPGDTAAQSTPTDSLRIPALMISVGAGGAKDMGDWRDGGPVQVVSAQFLVGRHLAVEGEATRWKTHTINLRRSCPLNQPAAECTISQPGIPAGFEQFSEIEEGWSGGANLLFRSEPDRRVSGFVGGGGFVGQRRSPSHVTCTPTPSCLSHLETFYIARALGGQVLGGADVQVTGPLRAYADLRFTALAGQVRLAATGGVRVVAYSRPAITDVQRRIQGAIQATVAPAEAAGKKVRVSLATGARRHGRFVSLSMSELLLRDGGQDIRYPLDQVLLVETVHKTALKGALLGGGVGVAAGLLVAGALFPNSDTAGGFAYAMPYIGTGAGAIVGALMDMAAADKHVVYAATARTVRVAPTLTPTRAGGTLTVHW
jgi:hypothetical protein